MVHIVGGREHLALVYVVYLDRFEYLRLDEVPDTHLRHYGNGNGVLYLRNHLGIGHARNAALFAYICGHAFERHYRDRARALRYLRLLGVGDVHDNAAL